MERILILLLSAPITFVISRFTKAGLAYMPQNMAPNYVLCPSLRSRPQYLMNTAYRSENPNLLADLNTSAVSPYGYRFGARTVDHISFSSGGGWFIRYSDRTVRLSMTGTFPEKFFETAQPYMQTQNWSSSPQQSSIKYVFFGAGDTFLISAGTAR